LAGLVLVLWGRSIVNSFKRDPEPIKPLDSFIVEQQQNYLMTPTMLPININLIFPTNTPMNTPTITPTKTKLNPVLDPTVTPTVTPWYTDMYIPNVPGIAWVPEGEPDLEVDGRISYYYPPYAYLSPEYEMNCDKIDGVLECEHMANGQEVKYFIGEAVACPVEFPFGTVIKVWGGYYTCRDRGGAIVKISENTYWFDVLYPTMPAYKEWGALADVQVWYP